MRKIAMLILFVIAFSSASFAEDVSIETVFLESVTENGGYINYGVEVTEHKNGEYTLSILVKENILGVDLGFFASPNILKNFEEVGIKGNTYIENEYFYIMAEKKYENFESLSIDLYLVSGYSIAKDGKEIIGIVDLTIWNEERKVDEVLNLVYSTNKYLFSYNPLKKLEGNFSAKNGENYVWSFENDSENYIFARPVNNIVTILIISVVGILIFSFLVFLIMRISRR